MYVAHTGADRVDVLDCDARTFLRSLPELPGVAGVLVDEEHDLLFTSDREAARVSIFRCSDERLLGQVEVGPHPNGLAYDRRRRRLYAFNLGEPLGEALQRLRRRPRLDAGDRRAAAARPPALGALRRGARPRLREHPRAGADRRHRRRARRDRTGLPGAERGAARALARLGAPLLRRRRRRARRARPRHR